MFAFAKTLAAISVCGLIFSPATSFAQNSDSETPSNGAQADSTPATEQSATAAPVQLGQGTKAQAEHSAEATAHKSVNDPNNQLGTSLQGRTRPVAGANNGPPYDTASADTAAPADSLAKAEQE